MSELHEDLLAPRITKKRIIAVLLVTGFLISFFAFSVYLTSFLFGTQRIDPSERVEDAEFDEYLLVLPPLPDDFKDLLDDLDLDDLDINDLDDLKDLGIDVDDISQEDLDELAQLVDEEDIADFLEEMNDGDIDNFDLTEAGLLIAALLFSDVEVFRVYKYGDSIEDREDILWRYECFDQFNGDGWESTVPKSTMPEYDFPTLNDYFDIYRPLGYDDIMLKRILSTNPGTNSFVMGTLFPEPYIIEETISADNLNPDPALSRLYKDDMECVIADLYFNSAENVSFYYEQFGWGINPNTNEEINNTAVNAIYTPNLIKNQFLQLPPNIGTYKTNNPFFNAHWNALNSTINANDNAFMVANKIRNYLQSNFELSFDELIDDPPVEGEDIVEWFCEKEEGLYSEFASAFCAFTRSFGVASRFVNGYNSRIIEEIFDNYEGLDTYAIKYKNIYDWAEIYVPGHGQWVQMDILYESFGQGGMPITEERYNLTVTSNATKPLLTYERSNIANITATLNSTTYPVDGELITFEDLTTGQTLGFSTTNIDGIASIEVNIDNNFRVGPHAIKASRGGAENWTYFIVKGDVNVNVTQLFPQEVNVSIIPHVTSVQGFVEDAITHERLNNVELKFLLLYKGTNTPVNVPNPFVPMYTYTDGSGNFDLPLTVEDYIPFGQYDFRVDFNGTWAIPIDPYLIPFNNINDSSDLWDFNVTKEITKSIWFYINDTEVWDYNNPIVTRPSTIELKAIVLNETGGRSQGDLITFYDYTNNSIELGSSVTDANGVAIFNYDVDLNALAGPNLLYAKLGNVENYSYFILDSPIDVNLDLGPQPSVINSTTTTGRTFFIHGYLTDIGNGKPIKYGEISVHLFDGPTDVSFYLIQESGTTQLNETGEIYVRYSVSSSIPTKNYTIQVWFNGTFLYSFPNNLDNEHNFFLNWIPNFSDLGSGFNELEVVDPTKVEIFLSVEGTPTTSVYNDLYLPERYNREEEAHFQITIIRGSIPAATGIVRLRDVYTNQILANYTYDGSEFQPGFIQLNVSTQLLHAGLHRLEVRYDSWGATNITYIIINETVTININPFINKILRDNGGFIVSGNVEEFGNFSRGLEVRIILLNSSNDDVSYYLIFEPGYQQNIFIAYDGSGYYEFRIDYIDLNCPYGEYDIRIDFNGSINAPGIFVSNYMVNTSSSLISLNISAGTLITQGPYSTENEDLAPDYWINGDILHVFGGLNWDNGTVISGFIMNVTVQLIDGTIVAYNDTATTDFAGTFEALLTIDTTWPDLRSDTKIVVYFNPIIENVESSEREYT
jgi:hypothetical protein